MEGEEDLRRSSRVNKGQPPDFYGRENDKGKKVSSVAESNEDDVLSNTGSTVTVRSAGGVSSHNAPTSAKGDSAPGSVLSEDKSSPVRVEEVPQRVTTSGDRQEGRSSTPLHSPEDNPHHPIPSSPSSIRTRLNTHNVPSSSNARSAYLSFSGRSMPRGSQSGSLRTVSSSLLSLRSRERLAQLKQQLQELEITSVPIDVDLEECLEDLMNNETCLVKAEGGDATVFFRLKEENVKLKCLRRRLKIEQKQQQVRVNAVKQEIQQLLREGGSVCDLGDNDAVIGEDDVRSQASPTDRSVADWVQHQTDTVMDPVSKPNDTIEKLERRLERLRKNPQDSIPLIQTNQPQHHSPPIDGTSATINPTHHNQTDQFSAVLKTLAEVQLSLAQGQEKQRTVSEKFLARQVMGKKLPKFDGNSEEWPSWHLEYVRTTEDLSISNTENRARLKECLTGKAASLVASLLNHPDNVPEVIHTLWLHFGRPEQVAKMMIKKASQIPPIRHNDLISVVDFTNAVINLGANMKLLNCESDIDNVLLMDTFREKLTNRYKEQWIDWLVNNTTDGKENMTSFLNWCKSRLAVVTRLVTYSDSSSDNSTSKKGAFERKKKPDVGIRAIEVTDNLQLCYYCGDKSHRVYQCTQLKQLGIDERQQLIKKKGLCFACLQPHFLRDCKNKRTCNINGCKEVHNRFLHGGKGKEFNGERKERGNKDEAGSPTVSSVLASSKIAGVNSETTASSFNAGVNITQPVPNIGNYAINATSSRYVTVQLKTQKNEETVLALLDEGSELTLLHSEVADRLGVEGVATTMNITTYGNCREVTTRRISCQVRGEMVKTHAPTYYNLDEVHAVPDLNLKAVSLDPIQLKEKYSYLKNVPLPSFRNIKPMMIIGSLHEPLIYHLSRVEGKWGEPIAFKSKLGWSVIAHSSSQQTEANQTLSVHRIVEGQLEDLHELVKESFCIEKFGVSKPQDQPRSREDERAIQTLEQTTKVSDDGVRYETGLLWSKDRVILPDSYNNALFRLQCQERKMDKSSEFASAYCAKFETLLEKGFIRLVDPVKARDKTDRTWYLPHFGVLNPNKPGKLRLVFDAAARTRGVSLNSFLLKGPDLNAPLASVLLKFRQFEYAFGGDIKDMFCRVYLRKEDHCSQRLLFRGMERNKPPDVYESVVVNFGFKCSPVCALYVRNEHAKKYQTQYPEAFHSITKKSYMDDLLDSTPTVEEAITRVAEINEVLDSGGFMMCNWVGNSSSLIQSIPETRRSPDFNHVEFKSEEVPHERLLGMWWDPVEDKFTFKLNFHKVPPEITQGIKIPTKRQVLSLIMSVFDPLGLLGHVMVKTKIIMQDVWRSGIGWDDTIPNPTYVKWQAVLTELRSIVQVGIPRCYSTLIPDCDSIQLHVFTDGSEQAYAVVAFLRVQKGEEVMVNIVLGRSRVAPLKAISIPRMELLAAVMGARMAKTIKEELEFPIGSTRFWCDSMTVLRWINSDSRNYKQFVSYRVGELQEISDITQWSYVPTELNAADDATRDNAPADLSCTSRWFCGPTFLLQEEKQWPQQPVLRKEHDEEEKSQVVTITKTAVDWRSFQSFNELIRTFALQSEKGAMDGDKKGVNEVTLEDMEEAEQRVLMTIQEESFSNELKTLTAEKSLPRKSSLFKLSPFISAGILRMHGRLINATAIPLDTKCPIILDWKHPATKLLVKQYHDDCGHVGRATIAAELRGKYWIIGITSAVKESFRKCSYCQRRDAKPHPPMMAPLPACRLESHIRPFTNTGLDYFGPIEVIIGRSRKKRWGCIFTCLSTRAIHLEVAEDLTADAAINVIRRFSNRRGYPRKLYSDNGTSFHGANNELKKALAELDQGKVQGFLLNKGTQWYFNPPGTPHMGGAWERLVGSTKKVLDSMLLGEAHPPDILHTFLTEAESIINKRPLTPVSTDPGDDLFLAPWHFLVGWPQRDASHKIPEEDLGLFDNKDLLRKKWRAAQRMADIFWTTWVKQYLPTLNQRKKWNQEGEEVRVGDIVLVVDDNVKRNGWVKGTVSDVIQGKDGIIRAADVKTDKGILRRGVIRLVKLEDLGKD